MLANGRLHWFKHRKLHAHRAQTHKRYGLPEAAQHRLEAAHEERERGRDRDRQTETDRQSETETDRDRDRETERVRMLLCQ